MTASAPTVIATSGGLVRGKRTEYAFGALIHYAIELSHPRRSTPIVTFLNTASGDPRPFQAMLNEAAREAKVDARHLNLFPMPNVANMETFLLESDVIWVGGGSVANLLCLWRLHGVVEPMERAWHAGVVLGGVSAGSICWHVGGTTDSFGPELRPITNGLGMLPYSNAVHYDSEPQRRPLFHKLIETGQLPVGYATEDHVGLHFEGTTLERAVTELPGKVAYFVDCSDGVVSETALETSLITKNTFV
ncbi:Peptidase E [Ferrithrix thermotolerans DSM 19514]|uniref:Peptidase E n=1 Tax=Ferrithrix thermotolerans DSM 19514 TaxID=1121881 RepID=A0A1M4XYD5_9ACTN|nr:peptidase E [Ferrithrix thermotolerans]SHE98252.1 Peptidase E [Ferrithrix thermotolerans DSM 19514]